MLPRHAATSAIRSSAAKYCWPCLARFPIAESRRGVQLPALPPRAVVDRPFYHASNALAKAAAAKQHAQALQLSVDGLRAAIEARKRQKTIVSKWSAVVRALQDSTSNGERWDKTEEQDGMRLALEAYPLIDAYAADLTSFHSLLASYLFSSPRPDTGRAEDVARALWRDLRQPTLRPAHRTLAFLDACRARSPSRLVQLSIELYLAAAISHYLLRDRKVGGVGMQTLETLVTIVTAPSADIQLLSGDNDVSPFIRDTMRALRRFDNRDVKAAGRYAELLLWWRRWAAGDSVAWVCDAWSRDGAALYRLEGVWRALTARDGYEVPIDWREGVRSLAAKPVLTPGVVTSFLGAFARGGRPAAERSVWHELRERQLTATPAIWHAQLTGTLTSTRVEIERVREVATKMGAAGILPPTEQKIEVIGVLMRDSRGQDEVANSLLDDLIGRAADMDDPGQLARLATVLLRSHRIAEAFQVVEIACRRLTPDGLSRVADAFLAHYAASESDVGVDRLQSAFTRLRSLGATPSVKGLLHVVKVYLRADLTDDAFRVLRHILDSGERPPRRAFELVILHCTQRGTSAGLNAAKSALERMRGAAYPSDVYMYTAIIGAYCRSALRSFSEASTRSDGERALQQAEELIRVMQDDGVEPNRITYTELIRAHLARRTPDGVKRGTQLFEELVASRRGEVTIAALSTPWCVLLEGLEANGEADEVRRRVAWIRSHRKRQSGPLRKLLARLAREYEVGPQKPINGKAAS